MNTLKYIIVGVVLYTITACTATHYTVIESKGYTIPVTERLDASPDASVAEIINIYKNIHHFLQMGLMNQRNNIKRKTENALILLLILMIKAMILLILTIIKKHIL